eukprot:COSAG04_NODE_380_length_15462_cov_2.388401_7_plen_167_part_00
MTEQGKHICRHIVAEPGVRTRRTHAQTHAACSSDRNRLSAVCCSAGGARDPVEAGLEVAVTFAAPRPEGRQPVRRRQAVGFARQCMRLVCNRLATRMRAPSSLVVPRHPRGLMAFRISRIIGLVFIWRALQGGARPWGQAGGAGLPSLAVLCLPRAGLSAVRPRGP